MKKLLLITFLVSFSARGLLAAACIQPTEKNADYSEPANSNTVTMAVKVNAVGDGVMFTAWCYTSCTPTSINMASQTAVQTSIGGSPGPGSPGSGQGFIFYILSASASGSLSATFTANGSPSQVQMSYVDFAPGAGCQFVHDVDSPLGSCLSNCGTSGNPGIINAPSITPTAGDLLFVFTWSSEHVNDINSPWSCPVYTGSGETGDCQFDQTRNVAGYILSAASGSTANNTTDTHRSDTWQALITSFSEVSASTPNPPTGLAVVVN